jgi:hypothetical protein
MRNVIKKYLAEIASNIDHVKEESLEDILDAVHDLHYAVKESFATDPEFDAKVATVHGVTLSKR